MTRDGGTQLAQPGATGLGGCERQRGGARTNITPSPNNLQIVPGVWARRKPDGRHCVFGAPLANAFKLLERIFKLRQEPGKLLWAAQQPLHWDAWAYIVVAIGADRLQPLLQHGHRVLEPLPRAQLGWAWGMEVR
jgi:hypothetical protein